MILLLWGHFDKKTLWSLIYILYEQCLFWYLAHLQILGISLYYRRVFTFSFLLSVLILFYLMFGKFPLKFSYTRNPAPRASKRVRLVAMYIEWPRRSLMYLFYLRSYLKSDWICQGVFEVAEQLWSNTFFNRLTPSCHFGPLRGVFGL